MQLLINSYIVIKKLLLFLITLTTLTNVSYASFPVADTLKVKLDTVQTETLEQYHIRMQKQGFDISSCTCLSCREGNTKIDSTSVKSRSAKSLYTIAAVLFVLALLTFMVGLLDGVACINDVSTCSSNNTPLILELSLLMIFGYSSIFYFIKGLSIQRKNKK